MDKVIKRYGNFEALKGVSFEVDEGEVFGVLGPNGAGKSTLLKILGGIIKPDAGTVSFLGIDVVKNPVEVRKIVGIVPEIDSVPSYLTPREYLRLVCSIRKSDCDVDKYIDIFSIPADKLIRDLSRGNRQKVMLAAAFIHNPRGLILDEPLVNLDPYAQKDVIEMIKRFARENKVVILATHIVSIAQRLCDRIAIINKGEIVKILKVKETDVEAEFFNSTKPS